MLCAKREMNWQSIFSVFLVSSLREKIDYSVFSYASKIQNLIAEESVNAVKKATTVLPSSPKWQNVYPTDERYASIRNSLMAWLWPMSRWHFFLFRSLFQRCTRHFGIIRFMGRMSWRPCVMSYNQRNRRCLFDFDISCVCTAMRSATSLLSCSVLLFFFFFFFVCSQLIGCGRNECLMNRTHLTHEFPVMVDDNGMNRMRLPGRCWQTCIIANDRIKLEQVISTDWFWLHRIIASSGIPLHLHTKPKRSYRIINVAMHFSSNIRHDTETLWLSKRN